MTEKSNRRGSFVLTDKLRDHSRRENGYRDDGHHPHHPVLPTPHAIAEEWGHVLASEPVEENLPTVSYMLEQHGIDPKLALAFYSTFGKDTQEFLYGITQGYFMQNGTRVQLGDLERHQHRDGSYDPRRVFADLLHTVQPATISSSRTVVMVQSVDEVSELFEEEVEERGGLIARDRAEDITPQYDRDGRLLRRKKLRLDEGDIGDIAITGEHVVRIPYDPRHVDPAQSRQYLEDLAAQVDR